MLIDVARTCPIGCCGLSPLAARLLGTPVPARGYLDADVTIDAIGEREFTSTPDERRVRRS